MKTLFKRLAVVLVYVILADAAVGYALAHPVHLEFTPRFYSLFLRGIYLDGGRNIIQFEPACAQYDAEVSYTFKPGSCVFENPEFRVECRINSLGLRDSESDLKAPEVIVIGDSRAMWGVHQDEMYSEVLARLTGRKILNAAVSSYGTVREMKLFDRLDASQAKTIVVHYVANDYDENKAYARHGNALPIMSRQKYEKIRERYVKGKGYHFGRNAILLVYRLAAEAWNGAAKFLHLDAAESDTTYFLNALVHARRTPLDGVQFVIMGDRDFIGRLGREIRAGDYPAYVEKAVLVPDNVPEEGFFRLDNHMNATGHRLVAERLAQILW